jgi:hypothetical protein
MLGFMICLNISYWSGLMDGKIGKWILFLIGAILCAVGVYKVVDFM